MRLVLVVVFVLAPPPGLLAFTVPASVHRPSSFGSFGNGNRPSTSRVAYSYPSSSYSSSSSPFEDWNLFYQQPNPQPKKESSDDGGLAAYARAFEAAYGLQQQQQAQPQNQAHDQISTLGIDLNKNNDNNNNNDWVAQQVQDFLLQQQEDPEGVVIQDHPNPEIVKEDVQVLPKASVPAILRGEPEFIAPQPTSTATFTSTAIPTRENDIADDFIALKYDIEQYIFSQTADTVTSAALAATPSTPDLANTNTVPDATAITWTTTTTTTPPPNSWIPQELSEVQDRLEPLQTETSQTQPEEPSATIMKNTALEQFAEAIDTPLIMEDPQVFNFLELQEDPSPQDYYTPIVDQILSDEAVAVILDEEVPLVMPESLVEEEIPDITVPAELSIAETTSTTFPEIVVAPTISNEAAIPTDIGLLAEQTTETQMQVEDKQVEQKPEAFLTMLDEQQAETTPLLDDEHTAEALFAMPPVANVTPENIQEQLDTIVPAPLEVVNDTPQQQQQQQEATIVIVEEIPPVDLSFAFSPPGLSRDKHTTIANAEDQNDATTNLMDTIQKKQDIDENALNDLVSAIEQFGESEDVGLLVAALESNPISETTTTKDDASIVQAAAMEYKATETARIVDLTSTKTVEGNVQALQASTRPLNHHDKDVEPPAVVRFLGNLLTKDLPKQAKKLPDDLKPLVDIAGNLWTNTFGKWAESIAHGTVANEGHDPPSEVFYFNLNTQQGEWDPSSDDITKSQMLSNEQGKSWTATIDSRGNFFVHYYDKEEDAPAPQLIATDKTWDKFSNGAGRVYYVNRETGHSQWAEPKGFGWDEQAVRSLNNEIMGKLFDKADRDHSKLNLENEDKHHQVGAGGFRLPPFFEKIAANSKKFVTNQASSAVQVEEKVYFEPKPPKEGPWWKAAPEQGYYDPKKLRP